MSDLSKLRAEVEALRDEAHGNARVVGFADANRGNLAELNQLHGAAQMATRVLDLIDKHIREGQ